MTNTQVRAMRSAAEAASFIPRHIGPIDADVRAMLDLLGYDSLDALIDATVPAGDSSRAGRWRFTRRCRSTKRSPSFARIARKNQIFRSYLGLGYYDT